MAKHEDNPPKPHHDLSVLGKELTRRSHAQCELCHAKRVALQAYEVPPIPDELDIDDCLFLCQRCLSQIEGKVALDADHWHCLHTSVWSTMPALQVTSVRVLKRLAQDHRWARDLLDELYLDPAISAWVDHEDC